MMKFSVIWDVMRQSAKSRCLASSRTVFRTRAGWIIDFRHSGRVMHNSYVVHFCVVQDDIAYSGVCSLVSCGTNHTMSDGSIVYGHLRPSIAFCGFVVYTTRGISRSKL